LVRLPANPTTAAPDSVIVPLLVTPPVPNERVAAALSVKAPPVLMATAPLKVFVLDADETVNVDALATVVVPVTVNVKAAAVKTEALVPSPTSKLPPMVKAALVVAFVVAPLTVRLCSTLVLLIVLAPEPERIRL